MERFDNEWWAVLRFRQNEREERHWTRVAAIRLAVLVAAIGVMVLFAWILSLVR